MLPNETGRPAQGGSVTRLSHARTHAHTPVYRSAKDTTFRLSFSGRYRGRVKWRD